MLKKIAHGDIAFKQIDIVERGKIIQLIIEKPEDKGKVAMIIEPSII